MFPASFASDSERGVTMEEKTKIELLAPVGNMEALRAAVQNGADAVYMGGKSFNARQYAQNFDNEELREAVAYAHLYGVKVYVTVNTLLDNSEIPELIDYLYTLQAARVDALIVQDLGVIRLIRSLLPEMELHASTQMNVHNPAGIRFLEEIGLKRVVLAREVSLENIALLRQNSTMPLEVFVHGALCVCYSGQCLMSSMIGGRSGNRGRCAQPCRLNYTLVNSRGEELQTGHLLSPRDLKMIEHLPLLLEAGISSLKVEGRMKRPEYVATVIRNYRVALDYLYELRKQERLDEYAVSAEARKELVQIFNRDFTTGYFLEKKGPHLMSFQRPNNRGLMIGRVTAYKPATREVTIDLQEPLRLGDGYEIWVSKGGRAAGEIQVLKQDGRQVTEVLKGQATTIIPSGHPRVGDRVFKTYDSTLMATAQKSYLSPQGISKFPLNVKIRIRLNEPVRLEAEDEQGHKVQVTGSFVAERAVKYPLTPEAVAKQLDRLGNTIFFLDKLEIDLAGEIMVPVSELNNLRREMVEKLLEQRLERFNKQVLSQAEYEERVSKFMKGRKRTGAPPQEDLRREMRLAVQVGDLASLKAAVDSDAAIVYFGGENYRGRPGFTEQQWPEALSCCREHGVEAVLVLPRIFHEDQAPGVRKLIEKGLKTGITSFLAGNLGSVQLCREEGVERIYGDYSLNVFNDLSIEELREKGVKRIAMSPELTLEQLKAFSVRKDVETECLIHGQLPLMITEQCTVGNILGTGCRDRGCPMPCRARGFGLKDRLNMVFPLECDENCRLHVFNPKTLSLLDRLPDLLDSNIAVFRIDGRREEDYWIRKVVALYRQELSRVRAEGPRYKVRDELKEELLKLSPAGLTSGHYYRGVL